MQKGRSDLKLASLRRDRELIDAARQVATEIIDSDRTLKKHQLLREELRLLVSKSEAEYLFRS
jgi:ATP-dependent DNA helicase RecG